MKLFHHKTKETIKTAVLINHDLQHGFSTPVKITWFRNRELDPETTVFCTVKTETKEENGQAAGFLNNNKEAQAMHEALTLAGLPATTTDPAAQLVTIAHHLKLIDYYILIL